MSNLISLTRTCLHKLGKTQMWVFPISRQSLIKENRHNSRTSDDTDLKLGPVTTKIDAMSANCDVIDIFSIYGQFGQIQKPDSACKVCKTYIFINSNLLSSKNLQT